MMKKRIYEFLLSFVGTTELECRCKSVICNVCSVTLFSFSLLAKRKNLHSEAGAHLRLEYILVCNLRKFPNIHIYFNLLDTINSI
jgi:hypothetical protein